MLVDTDVLVWLTRGHQGAASQIKQFASWSISAVTYIELAQGCRDKSELERLKSALGGGARILFVTEAISARAMLLIERYALSDGLRLADALIAATAIENSLSLCTWNVRHFASIDGLRIERFDPDR